jgi:type II pantothenate kinase
MLVLGIDIGGSATKAIGVDETGGMTEPVKVKNPDPLRAVHGILIKFLKKNELSMNNIDRIVVTGIGASQVGDAIDGIPCAHADEFECTGRGGLYLAGKERAIVISMGTGTAVILAEPNEKYRRVAGTGIGGGTLSGLARLLFSDSSGREIAEIARKGDAKNVDMRIGDMRRIPNDPDADLTMSNFGKAKDGSRKADLAAALVNMALETISTIGALAANGNHVRNIIVVGGVVQQPQSEKVFKRVGQLYHVHFIIPENPQYGTAIGAALKGLKL